MADSIRGILLTRSPLSRYYFVVPKSQSPDGFFLLRSALTCEVGDSGAEGCVVCRAGTEEGAGGRWELRTTRGEEGGGRGAISMEGACFVCRRVAERGEGRVGVTLRWALLGVSGRMGSCLTPRWVCWDDWVEGRREGLLWNSLGRRTSLLQLP